MSYTATCPTFNSGSDCKGVAYSRNAEQAVRNMLLEAAEQAGSTELSAIDYLDDGSPICLKITINKEEGSAIFDFEGTGGEVRGNLNAPIAVTHSAIIYW